MTNIPKHIAIIMDGNRRWARAHGLPPIAGHAYVVEKVIEKLIERCGELGVEHLTLWAFSTENWEREKEEVEGLMNIFRQAIEKKAKRFVEKGARLSIIGDPSRFPPDIRIGLEKLIETSATNYKVNVHLAINYGGRDEIVRAVRRMVNEGMTHVSEETVTQHLDTAGMPDPELIIRAGGEQRLSGFLPWQSVYSEFYFTETLMPDFSPERLDEAIEEYQRRQRRFGK